MANIGVELKRLLTKLGGTPSKYDQTNELIHKITDQVNAGGSGGGATIRIVELLWDEDSGKEILSMSFNEIRQAAYNGEIVFLAGSSTTPFMLLSELPSAGGYPMYFSGNPYFETYGEDHYAKVDAYRLSPDETLTFIRTSWSVGWQEVSGD